MVEASVLSDAMDAYEADTGDLRPVLPQDLADAGPAADVQLSAEDDGQAAEEEDLRARWAGIIPADAIDQADAGVPSPA